MISVPYRYFIANIILTFVIFFNSSIEAKNLRILKSDQESGRSSAIIDKQIYIRFDKGFYEIEKVREILSKYDMAPETQILTKDQSIMFNSHSNMLLSSSDGERRRSIIRAEDPLLRTFRVSYNVDKSPEEICRWLLKSIPEIEIAEPCYVPEILELPNDPFASEQDMLKQIQAPEGWNVYDGDPNVTVGIIDNGLFQEHQDLKGSIKANSGEIPSNNIDDDANGYVDDYLGYSFGWQEDNTNPGLTYNTNNDHGSNSGGITGATYNNEIGMTGTAGKSTIFPVKATSNREWNYTPYGYEALVYAGVRGFKVVNCSWGSENSYSDVNRTIIEYAVSRDVAIVAAGGNNVNSIYPYYPAGYYGVLGVGEVSPEDNVTGITNLGAHVDIMAPGEGNMQTTNTVAGYNTSQGGTSSASPVVAGVVALVRGKYPNLNNHQSLELVRQAIEDIKNVNPGWEDILPGRVNMFKALSTDPMSIPGIRPKNQTYRTSEGIETQRFNSGDTAFLRIEAINHLGPATNVRFVLSRAQDPLDVIEVLSSEVNIGNIASNQNFTIDGFSFEVKTLYPEMIFLRIDIYADNNYHDFFLLPFTSSIEVTTFENNKVKFSVSDRGKIGFGGSEQNPQGFGFVLDGYENQLYFGSGLMATEDDTRAISAVHGTGPEKNDFSVIKPFTPDSINIGVSDDSESVLSRKIGLEIRQEFYIPPGDKKWARVKCSAKNISGRTLKNLSLGYLFDWDLNDDSKNNIVKLFPDAIPSSMEGTNAASEIAGYYKEGFPYFGSAVYSADGGAIAQAAGLTYDVTYFFSVADQIRSLNNGTSWQFDTPEDISYVVGMRFPGETQQWDSREYYMCFGTGDDEAELAANLQECLSGLTSAKEVIQNLNNFELTPNPADDIVTLKGFHSDMYNIYLKIFDVLGKEMSNISITTKRSSILEEIDCSQLPIGIYYMSVHAGNDSYLLPFVIMR
jgi:hypothetical protein